ncbi:MAG: GNAT family N-acetyltransferase [Dehalococcoidia bacterium]
MGTIAEAGLTIRVVPPAAADYEALASLVNEAYTVYPIMQGPRTDAAMVREEGAGTGEFLVAEAAGKLAGCGLVKPSLDVDWSYAEGISGAAADAMYFGLAAVGLEFMRIGIGRALLQRAEEMASERGFRRVVLTTLAELGLVGYYEAQGYTTTGTRAFEPGHWNIDVAHTLHCMEKQL